MTTRASAPHTPSHPDRRNDDLEQQRRALIERARQLGATADELGAELEALALQAEAVLHRLRNGRMH
jgi:hypothetical protein